MSLLLLRRREVNTQLKLRYGIPAGLSATTYNDKLGREWRENEDARRAAPAMGSINVISMPAVDVRKNDQKLQGNEYARVGYTGDGELRPFERPPQLGGQNQLQTPPTAIWSQTQPQQLSPAQTGQQQQVHLLAQQQPQPQPQPQAQPQPQPQPQLPAQQQMSPRELKQLYAGN